MARGPETWRLEWKRLLMQERWGELETDLEQQKFSDQDKHYWLKHEKRVKSHP